MKKLIVANWKMYLTLSQSVTLAKRLTAVSRQPSAGCIVLCPSFVALEEVAKVVKHTSIKLGAQDVEPEKRGAYTGQVGLDDLGEIGVQYVLVGHSERRRMFRETDAIANKKLRAVLKAGMRPILCIGEPLSVRKKGMAKVREYVGKQVRTGLKGVPEKDLKRVIIAYEPIWAISGGGGHAATVEDAETMHAHIRKLLMSKTIPILYGGSVSADNADSFLLARQVNGLLIGRASTDASQMMRILKQALR